MMSSALKIFLQSQWNLKPFKFYKIFENYSPLRVVSSKRSFSLNKKDNCDEESKKIFKEIYRFRYIRLGYAVNKIKWPQTLFMGVVIPTSAAMYFGGILEFEAFTSTVVTGVLITSNLYLFGNLCHRTVGFMYVSEDGSTLKLSYLDFWGARIDKEVPVDDVMPLADCPKSNTDIFYQTIHLYSADKLKLKLFLRSGGQVTDENRFVRVFGDYTKY